MRISKRVKFMWAVLAALASVTSAALVGATCCAPDPSDVFCPDSCTADRFSEDVYLCYECTEDEGIQGISFNGVVGITGDATNVTLILAIPFATHLTTETS